MPRFSRSVAIAVLTLAAASPSGAAAPGDPRRGEAFAARHCATCHAIGTAGDSAYSAAPPFRDVLSRSPIDYMTQLLKEGLSSEHKAYREMQGFVLSEAETADLAAYWRTLHVEPPRN